MRNQILVLTILATMSVACTGKKEAKASSTNTTKADASKEKALEAYRAKKRAAEETAPENSSADTPAVAKKPAAPASTVAVVDPNAPKKVFKVEVLPDGTVRSIPTAATTTLVDPATGVITTPNTPAAELAKRMLRQNAGFDPDAEIRVRTSVTTTEVTTGSLPAITSARLSDFEKLVGRYQVGQKVASADIKETASAEGFEVEILADYTLHVYVKSTDCEANMVFRVVRADGQNLSLDMQSYEPLIQNGSACDPIKLFLPDTNTDKDLAYKRVGGNAIYLEYDGGYIPLVAK